MTEMSEVESILPLSLPAPYAAAVDDTAATAEAKPEPDHGAFLRLLLRHESDLKACIGAMVGDRHAREDVFQDVALALWKSFGNYDPARSFGAWARGVAVHKILHERRRNARFPILFSDDAIQALADAFERTARHESDREAALAECLAKVPEKSSRLLAMRYAENHPCQAIARKLSVSVDAVYQTLSRLRTELEKCIRRRLVEPKS